MTLLIYFQQSGYQTFKAYYVKEVQVHLRQAFPKLVSYSRFVWLMARVASGLQAYLKSRQGACEGVSFIDSTTLRVCDNHRIPRHRVFTGSAARGKSSMGWFYGFKLHLLVNTHGDLLSSCCTPGNWDDRQPVPDLVAGHFGKVFADRGYLSQALRETLATQGIQFITDNRANMHGSALDPADKAMLRCRFLIETIFDQLKNDLQLDHTRHRRPDHFKVHLWATLAAYTHQPKKPTLKHAA